MKRTRAERRHFAKVAIARCIRTIKAIDPDEKNIDKDFLNQMVSTHCKPCSCPVCGNPRRYFKKHTLKEVKATEEFEEQLKETVNYDYSGSTQFIR
jgi:transposase